MTKKDHVKKTKETIISSISYTSELLSKNDNDIKLAIELFEYDLIVIKEKIENLKSIHNAK